MDKKSISGKETITDCRCKWKSCKRHGNCEECIDHHSNHKKYPLPFCKKKAVTSKETQ